jgi:hypothetical protein
MRKTAAMIGSPSSNARVRDAMEVWASESQQMVCREVAAAIACQAEFPGMSMPPIALAQHERPDEGLRFFPNSVDTFSPRPYI